MAIRDRFRRAMRLSDSASDALSQTDSNGTTSTANTSQSSSDAPSKKSSSKLSRTFTFRSRDKGSKDKKRIHPSEKPLTAQNLRHQEMLSHFTMTFGASDPDQIESASFMGVSPCCTRPSSRRGSLNIDSSRDDLSSFVSSN